MIILRRLREEICLKGVNNTLNASVTDVPSSSLTTILTLNASQKHKITRISCSGCDYAKFQLFIDSTLVETRRSGPQRNADFIFHSPLIINSSQIVDIKVTHFFLGDQLNFEATLYSII